MKVGYERVTNKSSSLVKKHEFEKFVLKVLDMPLKLRKRSGSFGSCIFGWWMRCGRNIIRYTKFVMQKLVETFRKLGCIKPEIESEILMLLVEGL